jgi:hypothetical protein
LTSYGPSSALFGGYCGVLSSTSCQTFPKGETACGRSGWIPKVCQFHSLNTHRARAVRQVLTATPFSSISKSNPRLSARRRPVATKVMVQLEVGCRRLKKQTHCPPANPLRNACSQERLPVELSGTKVEEAYLLGCLGRQKRAGRLQAATLLSEHIQALLPLA